MDEREFKAHNPARWRNETTLCWVCGEKPGKQSIFCSKHDRDWQAKGVTYGPVPDWCIAHPDFNGRPTPIQPVCGNCGQNHREEDYLCADCRGKL